MHKGHCNDPWPKLKIKLILKFGGIQAAADHFQCHASALRLAARGKCPIVLARLEVEIGETGVDSLLKERQISLENQSVSSPGPFSKEQAGGGKFDPDESEAESEEEPADDVSPYRPVAPAIKPATGFSPAALVKKSAPNQRAHSDRMLFSLNTVCAWLNFDHRVAKQEIECGRLRWAWNIARKDAAKVELRVARDSALAWMQQDFSHLSRAAQDEREFEAYLDQLLAPVTKLWIGKRKRQGAGEQARIIRASELMRLLNCDSRHILNLIADGCLAALKVPLAYRESPPILASSVRDFLKQRRLV